MRLFYEAWAPFVNRQPAADDLEVDGKRLLSVIRQPMADDMDWSKFLSIGFNHHIEIITKVKDVDGGYLIYGITDNCGMAEELTGIEITDKDKFELDLRNKLNPIMPKIPQLFFRFVEVKMDRYIVVIYIRHDDYAPYIHLENQKNYKGYKRCGNGKIVGPFTVA